MTETFVMPDGYQLRKQEIPHKLKGTESTRTAFCLFKGEKIVFVMWDRVDPNGINRVIQQIETFGATK